METEKIRADISRLHHFCALLKNPNHQKYCLFYCIKKRKRKQLHIPHLNIFISLHHAASPFHHRQQRLQFPKQPTSPTTCKTMWYENNDNKEAAECAIKKIWWQREVTLSLYWSSLKSGTSGKFSSLCQYTKPLTHFISVFSLTYNHVSNWTDTTANRKWAKKRKRKIKTLFKALMGSSKPLMQLSRELFRHRWEEHLAPAKINLNFYTWNKAKCELVTHRQPWLLQEACWWPRAGMQDTKWFSHNSVGGLRPGVTAEQTQLQLPALEAICHMWKGMTV